MRTSPLQRPAMKTLLIHGAALVMHACWLHGAVPIVQAWPAPNHACMHACLPASMVRSPSCMQACCLHAPPHPSPNLPMHAWLPAWPAPNRACMSPGLHGAVPVMHACILHAAHVPLSISPCMLPACLPTSFPPCYPAPMPLSPHNASFPRCSHSSWHSHGVGARSPHGPV